jgi:hypothetical protein
VNTRRADSPAYVVGDRVLVNTQNMSIGRPVQKLSLRWEGPFIVVKALSYVVTVSLPANITMLPTFHVSIV